MAEVTVQHDAPVVTPVKSVTLVLSVDEARAILAFGAEDLTSDDPLYTVRSANPAAYKVFEALEAVELG